MTLISEYEAATLTAMSPDLLRWFVSYAPKQGSNRKLKLAKKEDDTWFFDKNDVIEFDAWLKMPWPSQDGQRPPVPTGIRREIKAEAGGACAICHDHKDTCEAAHLDAVAASKNNHPENLIWLCANHHTAFDSNLFVPTEDEEEFVRSFKTVLRRFRIMLWRTQHQVSHTLFIVLDNCAHLAKELEVAKTPEQVHAVEHIAKKTLTELPKLAPISKTDPKYGAYKLITDNVLGLVQSKTPLAEKLKSAAIAREDYVAAFGFVMCPLCGGSGRHEGFDCPVCGGDREIGKEEALRVDLKQFDKVDCPICEGEGVVDGAMCPACGGEAQIDRRYADQIDVKDYEKVACPLCDQAGQSLADCPVCGGNGEVDRRDLDQIDLKNYSEVDCPLCNGSGHYNGRNCPECGGEGRLQRRYADQIDLRHYEKVDCPLCSGSGHRNGMECQICGGERFIDRKDLDKIDLSAYDVVECPVCEGQRTLHGEECPACGGEGEMERQFADNIDISEYR
ncbi:MAG: hypothetical protein KF810_11235 [Rhizobiaceae bacterium]|nr:hypothetical protein [Rhizobiaceae bacterium]